MSQSTPPPLDQYPGYFPAAKPPFWTRTKVGVVAGVLGLMLGGAATSGADEPAEDKIPAGAEGFTEAEVAAQVDAAVSDAQQGLTGDLAAQEKAANAELKAAAAELTAARRQARADLRQVRAAARVAQRRAVATAVAAAEQAVPAPQPFAGTPAASTDPRFSYCYEANDAGYGSYVRGQDPEYDWYEDADNDGVVCEF